MGEKKFRVQRATLNNKTFTILEDLKKNYKEGDEEKKGFTEREVAAPINVNVPSYASIPSRVILLLNLITAEDVMDDLEYREIVEDIRNVNKTYFFNIIIL